MEMTELLMNTILTEMKPHLNTIQLSMLQTTLVKAFDAYEINTVSNLPATLDKSNDYIIEEFLMCKELENLSPKTLKRYRGALRAFCTDTGYSLLNASTNNIRHYLLNRKRVVANVTAENDRKCISAFYTWANDEGYVTPNPCKKIKSIKDTKSVKKFYKDIDMESLRDACETEKELAFIDLLLSTGIRVDEVGKIKMLDIDWKDESILIHGKGNKERYVYMSPRCMKHLQEYIVSKKYDSPYLFERDRVPYTERYTTAMTNNMIKSIAERAGLKGLTTHKVRAWFASNLVAKGVDAIIIQELMGHSSFETTQTYYVNVDHEKVKSVHRSTVI